MASIHMWTYGNIVVLAGKEVSMGWEWSKYPQILPIASAYAAEYGAAIGNDGSFEIVHQRVQIVQTKPPATAIELYVTVKNVGQSGAFIPTLAHIVD